MNNCKIKKQGWMFIGIFIIFLMNDILFNPVAADTVKDTSVKSKEMIPFFWMVLIVGGCIAITLSYVSWRKYKGEKNKKKNKGKSID